MTKSMIRMISIGVIMLLISGSLAGELYPGSMGGKTGGNQAKWSFSLYGAMAYAGQFENRNNVFRNYGPSTTLSGNSSSFLSKIRPSSWMIEVDYRLTNLIGAAFLFSNTDLGEVNQYANALTGHESIYYGNLRIHMFSVLLLFHLHDQIILGVGPLYNLTGTPSADNQLGALAHLNIRIPVAAHFAINGIAQYRYLGGSAIGPYYSENSENRVEAEVATNSQIYPPNELKYSHLFIGVGITISSGK
jgi:hypothetical protein